MKSVRYSLFYKFFAAQIEFGYYKKGDFLPAIELLCKTYHAAPQTVSNAYQQLQTDGYITVSSGRKTTVIYEAAPEDYRLNIRNYYLARKSAILELNQALKVLFLPMMREGCRQLGRHELHEIREMAVRLEEGDFYISFFLGRTMLLALKNRLALNLFNEVVAFYQFPHALASRGAEAGIAAGFQTLARQIMAACDSGDREALYHAYLQLQSSMDKTLRTLMVQAEREHPPLEQVPFVWGGYRERPQLCYSLAARLIDRIYIGREYGTGQLLPTYGTLAKDYAVSFSTIRRTMELMNQLGVVATSQGAGTLVIEPTLDSDNLQLPTVKKIVTMLQEVMQILCLIFDAAAAKAEPTQEQTQRYLQWLQSQPQEAGIAAVLKGIDYLFSGLTGFAGIWEKFDEMLLLGLPLLAAEDQHSCSARDRLIEALKTESPAAFCAVLQDLMHYVFKTAESLAYKLQSSET